MMNDQFKSAVTVAEMARMVGLGRSRFYQLIGTAFPKPSRDEAGRPYYSEEQQRVVLEVRRRNCGIDGKPVLFYAARSNAPASSSKRPSKRKQLTDQHAEIIDAVKSLGLTTVTTAQVDSALRELFPAGTARLDSGEVIRSVFLFILRKNSSDNVG